jgi:hypothetical protein
MKKTSDAIRWLVRSVLVLCLFVEAGCSSPEVLGYCKSSLGITVTAHPPDAVRRIVGHGQACEGQTFACGSGSSDCNPKDGNANATFHPTNTGDCRLDVELIDGCILSQTVTVSPGADPRCVVFDRDSVDFTVPAKTKRDASADSSCSS